MSTSFVIIQNHNLFGNMGDRLTPSEGKAGHGQTMYHTDVGSRMPVSTPEHMRTSGGDVWVKFDGYELAEESQHGRTEEKRFGGNADACWRRMISTSENEGQHTMINHYPNWDQTTCTGFTLKKDGDYPTDRTGMRHSHGAHGDGMRYNWIFDYSTVKRDSSHRIEPRSGGTLYVKLDDAELDKFCTGSYKNITRNHLICGNDPEWKGVINPSGLQSVIDVLIPTAIRDEMADMDASTWPGLDDISDDNINIVASTISDVVLETEVPLSQFLTPEYLSETVAMSTAEINEHKKRMRADLLLQKLQFADTVMTAKIKQELGNRADNSKQGLWEYAMYIALWRVVADDDSSYLWTKRYVREAMSELINSKYDRYNTFFAYPVDCQTISCQRLESGIHEFYKAKMAEVSDMDELLPDETGDTGITYNDYFNCMRDRTNEEINAFNEQYQYTDPAVASTMETIYRNNGSCLNSACARKGGTADAINPLPTTHCNINQCIQNMSVAHVTAADLLQRCEQTNEINITYDDETGDVIYSTPITTPDTGGTGEGDALLTTDIPSNIPSNKTGSDDVGAGWFVFGGIGLSICFVVLIVAVMIILLNVQNIRPS